MTPKTHKACHVERTAPPLPPLETRPVPPPIPQGQPLSPPPVPERKFKSLILSRLLRPY